MEQSSRWYKENEHDQVWWLDTSDKDGQMVFSFDKKETFNLFKDYPDRLTAEEKKIFDKENPQWANFFEDR